jgi:N,N'-diacetyllegionaminate synthase
MEESVSTLRVIAEVGVNHNGSLDMAKEIIDLACISGVDIVKFQTAVPDLVQTPNAPKAQYQRVTDKKFESALEMVKSIHLPISDYRELKNYVVARGVSFMSTAFDLTSLEALHDLGEHTFKVPSGEINNLRYLERISQIAGEVILSTGMSTLEEVSKSLEILTSDTLTRDNVVILQCNTAYPTPPSDVNLRAMTMMGEYFGTRYGLSDHTVGVEASIAAVALGACVIEKHITLDKTLPGPDHAASLEVSKLPDFVAMLRNVEEMMGNPSKEPSSSEVQNKANVRRGVYAARDVKPGTRLRYEDLVCLRPENGTNPMSINHLIGKHIRTAKKKFDSIMWTDID